MIWRLPEEEHMGSLSLLTLATIFIKMKNLKRKDIPVTGRGGP
jgi:hypothetical protein